MKKWLLALVFLPTLIVSRAQVVGTMFPQMETETIDNAKFTLPDDTKGKYTLLGLAYSKKSEDELNSWFRPVYDKFIQKNNSSLFAGFGYDVYVYFVPMFTGVNAAAAGTAKRKAVSNVDPEIQPHILFYKGDLKPYKDALDFEKKDIPYFFVLDKDGKIIYATSGGYTDDKMDEVENVLQ